MPEFHGVKGFKYLSGRGLEFTDPMEDDMMETWEEEEDTSQFDVDLNWGESSRQSGGDKLLVGKLFATKKQGLEVLKDLMCVRRMGYWILSFMRVWWCARVSHSDSGRDGIRISG